IHYDCFVKKITDFDPIPYHETIECLIPASTLYQPRVYDAAHYKYGPQNIPQIRYPGLPWFSVFDNSIVASIGTVMAKTRTAPLDIATFFARQGQQQADPLALLLYAQDIPFQLIIDTKIAKDFTKTGKITFTLQKKIGDCYV